MALKAKKEPKYRFYSLYALISRKDVLETAWKLVKKNNGAAGIDGETINDLIQRNGQDPLLEEISNELKNKTYKPLPIKRVYIPKNDGAKRPLGIFTIKDRIVQTAVTLILEPIFEVNFLECSYGFRPKRTAHEAIRKVTEEIKRGYSILYDADMRSYLDTIPHHKLIACVRMKVTDGTVIKLIREWLKTPIIEKKPQGNPIITRADRGVPQGGGISPLLSNVYLHWFDYIFHKKGGPHEKYKAQLCRFADDFIVLMQRKTIEVEEFIKDKLERWMELELNMEKTKIVEIQKEGNSIDFLGFNMKYVPSQYRQNEKYLKIEPKKRAFVKAKARIKEILGSNTNCIPVSEQVKRVNRFLIGWSNYFKIGHPYKTFTKMDYYVSARFIKHLKRRSQRSYRKIEGRTWYATLRKLGIVRLGGLISAKA